MAPLQRGGMSGRHRLLETHRMEYVPGQRESEESGAPGGWVRASMKRAVKGAESVEESAIGQVCPGRSGAYCGGRALSFLPGVTRAAKIGTGEDKDR